MKAFVMMQRLMGQEETVVQHVQLLQEVCVYLHLLQQPRALLVCTQTHTPKQLLEFVIKKIVFLLGKFYNIGRLMLWAR